jgi:GNAT superfamily N-acetyltransferase
MKIVIREATESDLHQIRQLMRDYAAHLADHPSGAASICLTGYQRELEELPRGYAALLLAEVNNQPAGCLALRLLSLPLNIKEPACEIKRLWVDPAFRGHRLGRLLMEKAIAWAGSRQLNAVYLDTVPEAMPEASRLYETLGFKPTARYNENDVSGVKFFRLSINSSES